MKKLRVLTGLVCIGSLIAAPLFAGGGKESSSRRVVSTVCRASYANEQWFKNMNAAFTAETGIEVDVQPTPGNDADHNNKVNIDLLAGGTIDVIPTLGPRDQQGRVEAGYYSALNDVLKNAGIDAASIWGKYITYQSDGKFYELPYKQEIFCMLYNKDMFDKAGVPYPKGAWSWDEYIATARRLTANGQYGSYMGNDIPWYYMTAAQRGVPFYKKDGTSNYDDPAFAESLKWYYDLSHTQKVQMPVSEMLADDASWNYYAMKNNLAMFPQGNWFMRLLNSQADYPRDWKYGITQFPGAGGSGNTTFISAGYVSINKNAAHPKEALEYLVWLAKNQWRYEGGIPALVNLSAGDQRAVFEGTANASGGQITVDDLYTSLMGNDLGVVQSDIIGTAASEYTAIVIEEATKYMIDQQDLNATIRRIVSRTNEAIANVK
jgi:multiple sugar transport system substrate-binding protein